MKVDPVSEIDGIPDGIASNDHPWSAPIAERISMTFPSFVVAMMRRGMGYSAVIDRRYRRVLR